jgi:hypothetical protein
MKAYLTFRLKQAFRQLKSVGIGYLILLIILTLGITTSLLQQAQQLSSMQSAVLSFILAGTVHISRKDRKFISKLGHQWSYFIVDYVLFLIPLGILLLFLNGLPAALGSLAGLLTAFIPLPTFSKKSMPAKLDFLLNKIPISFFEWRMVIRSGGIFSVIIYLIMLGVSWSIPGFCLSIFFCFIIIPVAYEYLEPKEFITRADGFIMRKIMQHSALFQLGLLPLYLLFLISNFENWYFVPVAFILSECLLMMSIITKYKRYTPRRERVYLTNVIGAYILLLLLPGFVIAFIPLILIHGRQAQKKISYYYD